jgi:hypothetical protein
MTDTAREARKRNPRPSLNPQKLTGNEAAWYYEDRGGITVVTEARDKEGKYLGVTMQTRIPWSMILKSASRCGKIAEQR